MQGRLVKVASLPNAQRPGAIGKENEQVYAVHFAGDRGYVVTFRRTDPLYVLDLSNPADPKISPFIPEWLRRAAAGQPLVLLPVRDSSGTVTVFCGLRRAADRFVLTARQSQQLRALRQRLSGFEELAGRDAGTAGGPGDERGIPA